MGKKTQTAKKDFFEEFKLAVVDYGKWLEGIDQGEFKEMKDAEKSKLCTKEAQRMKTFLANDSLTMSSILNRRAE